MISGLLRQSQEMKEMLDDENLKAANPSLIHELLAPVQQEESA